MALKDKRYSITPEFTGHASGKKRFVVRFCDKYQADFASRDLATKAVASMKKERTASL